MMLLGLMSKIVSKVGAIVGPIALIDQQVCLQGISDAAMLVMMIADQQTHSLGLQGITWESAASSIGATTPTMHSVCSSIARCWDTHTSMHAQQTRHFKAMGAKLRQQCWMLVTDAVRKASCKPQCVLAGKCEVPA